MATDLQSMQQILQNVFDIMLEMPTAPGSDPGADAGRSRYVAAIRITGDVNELIVVEAPPETAAAIGETMFAADPGTLSEDELSDAVGEVVNMIGGNVKGMHDGDSLLSLPCVTRSDEAAEKFRKNESLWIHVAGQPLYVHWQDMEHAPV